MAKKKCEYKKKLILIFLVGIFLSSFVSAGTGEDINASSTNYFIKSFSLGLQSYWNEWQNVFSTFLSFNDGMTGDAESSSYKVNVGPLSKYTNYEQCFRTTCSQLGYNCDSGWDDSCGGFLNCGTCGTNYQCYSGVCTLDEDNDTIDDNNDNLIGEVGDLQANGLSNKKFKVNNSEDLSGQKEGVQDIEIYDGSDLILKTSHNFSKGKIYLRNINIVKGNNYLITNLSSQLSSGETKILYIDDNDFIGLCVKDEEISSVNEISSDCSGANEFNFVNCLGNSSGYANGTLICYDEGSRIRIENLSYSGILGIVESQDSTSISSSGSKTCSYNEEYDWECSDWSACIEGVQTRTCKERNNCGNSYGRPETEKICSGIIPENLFYIKFSLEDKTIFNSSELVGIITFENFGTIPTLTNLTFLILDDSGNEVYFAETKVLVDVEEILRWDFGGLQDLEFGEYKVVLQTLYGDNVYAEFNQEFRVEEEKNLLSKSFKVLILLVAIFVLFWIIFFLIKIIKNLIKPGKIKIKKYSDWEKEKRRALLNKDVRKIKKFGVNIKENERRLRKI